MKKQEKKKGSFGLNSRTKFLYNGHAKKIFLHLYIKKFYSSKVKIKNILVPLSQTPISRPILHVSDA